MIGSSVGKKVVSGGRTSDHVPPALRRRKPKLICGGATCPENRPAPPARCNVCSAGSKLKSCRTKPRRQAFPPDVRREGRTGGRSVRRLFAGMVFDTG